MPQQPPFEGIELTRIFISNGSFGASVMICKKHNVSRGLRGATFQGFRAENTKKRSVAAEIHDNLEVQDGLQKRDTAYVSCS